MNLSNDYFVLTLHRQREAELIREHKHRHPVQRRERRERRVPRAHRRFFSWPFRMSRRLRGQPDSV